MADDDKDGSGERNNQGRLKDKLITAKTQWARAGRLLTGEKAAPRSRRLPPGQRLVKDWPVLDLGIQPLVLIRDWTLTVDGLVEQPGKWNWPQFLALPQTDDVSDMHCVTAWSRYDNRWTGVMATDLLALVRPKPEAKHVILHSHDGYTTNVTLAHFADPDVIIAHRWEGEPISREHGGPVRLIMPRFYLWKSAKWLRRIEFRADDRPGFWEVRGYHNEGDPWKEDRYG